MAERSISDPNAWTSSTALFASFSDWATKAGERIGTQKEFHDKLGKRPGIAEHRRNTGRGFDGLKLNTMYVNGN